MKDELDKMNKEGIIKDKVVYDLLVEGLKCRLFVMDLKYLKLYRLFMISQFYLPRDFYDFGNLVSCFKRLVYFKLSFDNFKA